MPSNVNVVSIANRREAGPPEVLLNLADLRIFLVVAAEGSFSRAADKVCRTQPAVSQAVRRLERDVGHQLLNRSSPCVQLSPAGEVLRDYALRLFGLCDEAQTTLNQLSQAHGNRISIGVTESFVHTALHLAERFRNQRPHYRVDLRCLTKTDIAGHVASGTLDFGVVTEPPSNSSINSEPLATDTLVALMPANHTLAASRELGLADIANEVLLIHAEAPVAPRLPQSARVIPSLDAIKWLLEREPGIALLPRSCAVSETARGTLIEVPISDVDPIHVLLIHRHERHLSAAARALLALTGRSDAAHDQHVGRTESLSEGATA